MAEGRTAFQRELERLEISVGSLLGLVPEAIVSAANAAVAADREVAAAVARWRALVEDLYGDVERTIEVLVARQAPVARDLRFLLACFRLVPALHEVVDLVGEVASPGELAVGTELSSRAVGLTRRLGGQAAGVWASVEEVWATRDPTKLQLIGGQVDGLADTRSALAGELASGATPLAVALELAVVGRSLDRIGRTARKAGRVIAPLVPDQRPGGPAGGG